jgi:hypothetical protein
MVGFFKDRIYDFSEKTQAELLSLVKVMVANS